MAPVMVNDRESVFSALEIESLMRSRPDCVLLIDAGGVLFNNVIEDSAFIDTVAAEFDVDADALGNLYKDGDARFETNEVCARDFLESCLITLGVDRLDDQALQTIDRIFVASVVPDKEIFSALRRLRLIGRNLVLANNEGEHWERLKHRAFGHLDLFDTVASSWKLRACKPGREYFRRLQRVLYPTPKERWWLVDDNVDNVAAARADGIAASRYLRNDVA